MQTYRLAVAARLLGVSDDTVRRWAEGGRLPTARDGQGRLVVDGADLAALAVELAGEETVPGSGRVSARNRVAGIVTRVVLGDVVAQVEVQSGDHRFVSLMTREAVEELGLEPGTAAVASVKSTSVVVERA